LTTVNRLKKPSLEAFLRSIDGVAGGIAVPFTCVGDTVLENFF
jgi:hypothetical protein